MLDVHGRLRRLAAQSDPLARVADDIAEDIKVHDAMRSAGVNSVLGLDAIQSCNNIYNNKWYCLMPQRPHEHRPCMSRAPRQR